MNRDARETFRGVLRDRAKQSDGRRRACKRDRNDFSRDARARQRDEIARREVAPNERRGGADVEDGARFFACGVMSACEDGKHVNHLGDGFVCERARDDGFL